jgi:hypothetical protein
VTFIPLLPAKAGIQKEYLLRRSFPGPRFRGDERIT